MARAGLRAGSRPPGGVIVRALVVDDSRVMRSMLSGILREARFEVLEAGDGREGLEVLRRHQSTRPISLARVDWNMPVMSGYEMVCAVRADAALRGVRVLMATAENGIEKVAKALAAGADEYAMKPLTREVVLEKLAILGLVVP